MAELNSNSFARKAIQKVYGYGVQFVEGNDVVLLSRGKETFKIVFDAIKEAKEFVCLEFYIFRNDETGNELAEILKQKAKDGVRVYILYDHFGSLFTSMKFWKSLKQSGVHVRASHPFKLTSPFRYFYRDHKKLIIIDGEKAFTGGLNIANEYRGYYKAKRKEGWRDTGILLCGPVVGELLEIFKKSWNLWRGETIPFEKQCEPFPHGVPVIPIFASSAKGRRKMRKLLHYSIKQSRESIYLTTAYFTPSIRMQLALEEAVYRGVKVKLLLPGKSDIIPAHYAARAFYTKLLKAGVEIYNYFGEILHAKTSVFDETWSVIGSANLDFQSLRRNDEGNIGIMDKKFGQKMTALFNEDLEKSEKIILENWKQRSFLEKIKEQFFAIFRRRL